MPNNSEALAAVRNSLVRNYFMDATYLASEAGQTDLGNHLVRRLNSNRERLIPWVESFHSLDGARVLEIGCGTGASTLALAERGAQVTAIDIRSDSIKVARDRCDAYRQRAAFLLMNAADIGHNFAVGEFDVIVFYAVLEHMTHEERRAAMHDSWQMLDSGASWVVIETPNRLWYVDRHTALLPFYHWLPDDVAFEYARFSKRDNFRELYLEKTREKELHFLRRGRAVSFHEFDLFIAPTQNLEVVSCLHSYMRSRSPDAQEDWLSSGDAVFSEYLQRACPGLHAAFVEPSLDLALRKD